MGRRLLVIVSMLVTASAGEWLARGQGEVQRPCPAPPPAPRWKARDDIPFLNRPQAGAAGETDDAGGGAAGKSPSDGATFEQAKSKSTKSKTKSTKKVDPPEEVSGGFDDLIKARGPADADVDRP